jgi:hypothetical protein
MAHLGKSSSTGHLLKASSGHLAKGCFEPCVAISGCAATSATCSNCGGVPQVDRFTPATVEIGDIFTLTATDGVASAAVSFTATAATVANVTAGLTAAWNASGNALHTPITAADVTTSMTLTADTAGVPFSVAPSTTDGGGANTQTLTRTVVTANSGCTPDSYLVVFEAIEWCACGPSQTVISGNVNSPYCVPHSGPTLGVPCQWDHVDLGASEVDYTQYGGVGCTGAVVDSGPADLVVNVTRLAGPPRTRVNGFVNSGAFFRATIPANCSEELTLTNDFTLADCTTFSVYGYGGSAKVTPCCEVGI